MLQVMIREKKRVSHQSFVFMVRFLIGSQAVDGQGVQFLSDFENVLRTVKRRAAARRCGLAAYCLSLDEQWEK